MRWTICAFGLAALASIVTPSRAADWQDGAGPDWTALLAQARREGKVVISGRPEIGRPIQDAFKHDTGIDIEYLGGIPAQISTRLLIEARAHNVTMDLAFGGASDLSGLYRQGFLVALKPQMILPGVKDGPQWIGGKSIWADNEGQYLFRGTLSTSGRPVVNSSIIAPEALTNWKDLLAPQYRGKIASYDPKLGGPGQGMAAYIVERFGVEFLKALYIDQGVQITRDNRQLMEWVARGTYSVALGVAPVAIEPFRLQGLPLAVLEPKDGPGYVTSGFSVMKEMKGAPHPAAAAVFLNWYASVPGQIVYSRAMLEASTRADVEVPEVPEYAKPTPGITYLDSFNETWYTEVRPVVSDLVINALGGR